MQIAQILCLIGCTFDKIPFFLVLYQSDFLDQACAHGLCFSHVLLRIHYTIYGYLHLGQPIQWQRC